MDDVGSGKWKVTVSSDDAATGRRHRRATTLMLLSALLYGVSFLLPAFIEMEYHGEVTVARGYVAFFMAALSPFSDLIRDPLIVAAFLANPLLWASAVCFWRERYLASWVTSGLAAMLSMAIWLKLYEWLLIGYYVWVFSMVLFTVASAIAWMNSRQRTAPHGFEAIVP